MACTVYRDVVHPRQPGTGCAGAGEIELLPWDSFGLIEKEEEQLTDEDLLLLDELAELTQAEISITDVISVLEQNPSLQPPDLMP